MLTYLFAMVMGTVAIFALYGLRCAHAEHVPALRHRAFSIAGLSLLFAGIFGLVLARVCYALLMQELDFEYDGIAALAQLFELDIDNVSFFGGAVGVCLGVLLANGLLRKGQVAVGMDAFAPFGALLVALFRVGEVAFGSYGAGTSLAKDSPLAFFPFAVEIAVDGGYSYWSWAVFMLSAAFALLWAAISFFGLRSGGRKGLSFTLTLFFLALPQMLCESLRKRGMFWLFVHVEQLLCAIVLAAVMVYWIVKCKNTVSGWKKWVPFVVTAICFVLLVLCEFAIDGKILDLLPPVCYLIMCAILAVVGCCGVVAARRWNRVE